MATGFDDLLPSIYSDLRRLAARHMESERNDHTLQATALVHEAWLRMSSQRADLARSRSYVLAAASDVIRRVLVDHARGHGAAKRGAGWVRVPLEDGREEEDREVDMLVLDEALTELSALHERQARVVELRFFAGLGGDEAAEVLGVSPRTVDNDWRIARAWLRARLATRD